MEEKFKDLLWLLDVLETKSKTHTFDIDIHGYEKSTYYHEFRMRWSEKLKFSDLLFIDEVTFQPIYGFLTEEGKSEEDSIVINEQHGTKILIDSIAMEPFGDNINYNLIIKGEPANIDIIADTFPLQVKLEVTGCLNTISFWKQSSYLSYLLFKGNNVLSSFMHLFITFEGLIRDYTSNTTTSSIHKVFKNYTGQELPEYLDAYRKIRNQVMHGNENMASNLTADDLIILIETIESLENNRTAITLSETTLAIDEGLLLS